MLYKSDFTIANDSYKLELLDVIWPFCTFLNAEAKINDEIAALDSQIVVTQ